MYKTSIYFACWLCLFLIISQQTVNAQVDTLYVGAEFEHYDRLTEGQSTYILYREAKDGSLMPFAMKRHIILNDGELLKVTQEEFGSSRKKTLETWLEPKKMTTKRHHRTTDGSLESYVYTDLIIRADSELESENAEFSLELGEPTFNFEIDFEFMKVIPWENFTKVAINFYHPGGKAPPQYYMYTVEGEEDFELANGNRVSTWKIFTDYNSGSKAWFWVSKSTGEVVKQMQDLTEQAGFKFIKLKTYPSN
ncbi:MAG: hypothetical protein F6K19_19085 [Cyanothece sp. SIO1E1]|nr:hypothetical protein [Cyanothece sp. SIO1E1]